MPVDFAFTCIELPLCISPRGIVSPGGDMLGYDQMKSVTADERYLHINGRRYCRSGGSQTGNQIAALLPALGATTEAHRESLIGDFLAKRLDANRANSLVTDFFRRSAMLRRLSSIFYLYTIAVLVSAARTNLLKHFWLPLLAIYLLLLAAIIYLYSRAERHFNGKKSPGRIGNMLLMVAFPPYLVKAGGFLGEKLFRSSHPLACARAFLPPDTFTRFAGEYYRNIRFSSPETLSSDASEVSEWFNKCHIACVERFFDEIGFDVRTLLAKPEAENDKIRSYCPRCLAQYIHHSGDCPDCRIPLRPIGPSSKF